MSTAVLNPLAATTGLEPCLLLASAINPDGLMELPVVLDGHPYPALRALFWPGSDGDLRQLMERAQGASTPAWERARPLDPAFFSECLSHLLGPLTPALFRAASTGAPAHSETDDERRAVIRRAFVAHLLAYEERLL